MSSFNPARALKRVKLNHAVPAAGLALAAVAVAVTPLTASATTTTAASATAPHTVAQHTTAQHTTAKAAAATKASGTAAKQAAPAAKQAAPAAKAAAAPATQAPAKTTTTTNTTAQSNTATTVSTKPYAGVSYSSLEPTGTEGSQQRFSPSSDQWNNATKIVQAAKDMNMSAYAATIAVATAMQESSLHNLHYGDRDSLGLFQQRPSMGWGSASELTDPTYAAKAFLKELPSGYESMSLSSAAQSVQRSFDGSLYSQWESQAAYMVHSIANS
ncbi:hypothetical protein KDK95_31790 [Actinospica sp. MGRD01-02]|uniref:SCP domain-containing protein n=1 Tax=Actinospica acidithermotolerans TaxID=2828514 RepID=A0A941EDX3_9ACTN|nr:hypothetical protein [Actinospica acidithermotolerans]MBR7830930.1 hypothetical protein [Actinospica acidithermotolerans]